MANSQSKTRRRTVVEGVDCEASEPDDFGEALNHLGQFGEGIGKRVARRHVGLAEAGQVRGYDVKAIRQRRDQLAKHMAGGWKSVKQQQRRRIRPSGLPVKYLEPVDVGLPVVNLRHARFPLCLAGNL
jgi:hypothetical protein